MCAPPLCVPLPEAGAHCRCSATLCPTLPPYSAPQDIYLARAEGLLAAEERLYWRLIDLYRLPSLLFQMTGPNPAPSRPRH